MKIAVVGSRDFKPLSLVESFIQGLPDDSIIISGGARGVDSIAERAAKNRGLQTIIYPAQWDKYGKAAGMMRNTDIIKDSDIVVAFWDGKSRGTQDSIIKACKYRKYVYLVKTGD